MQNLLEKDKTIFLGKRSKRWNFPKTFFVYWSFLKICFEACEKRKSNLLSDWILVQAFIMPNFVNKYKTIFLGKRGWLSNFAKVLSPCWSFLKIYFGVCEKSQFTVIFFPNFLNIQHSTVEYSTEDNVINLFNKITTIV